MNALVNQHKSQRSLLCTPHTYRRNGRKAKKGVDKGEGDVIEYGSCRGAGEAEAAPKKVEKTFEKGVDKATGM